MKMHLHKTLIKMLLLLFLFITVTGTANAADIQNLSGKPQTIEVKGESGEYETITVDSGDNYRLPGLMRVRRGEQEVTIHHDEQFVIWSDTVMGPQRKSGVLNN